MGENYALELRDISKSFGSVQANDHVDLTLRKSEILGNSGGKRKRKDNSDEYDLWNLLSG